MEDIAHDASGPASPKPGDVAPQQASRSESSDRGKLRVFISYSRDDLNFANQLNAALDAYGFECFIDREGISGGEKWKRRIGSLISEVDTVVFVLSPTSSRSEICAWEVEEAARLNKRILPVNCRPLEGTSPPPRLRDLNYIFFYEDPKVKDSGFGTGLKSLVAALNTDFDWLREHTRYLQRATEWDSRRRPANRLLSGDDIAEAKDWVARRGFREGLEKRGWLAGRNVRIDYRYAPAGTHARRRLKIGPSLRRRLSPHGRHSLQICR